MNDLAQFLGAQYRQQIHVARLAAEKTGDARWKPDWRRLSEQHFDARVLGGDGEPIFDGYGEIVAAEYVVSHDPFRAIADLEAKLAILDHCQRVQAYAEAEQREEYLLAAGACEAALRILAQPFADHPGYREEWRPTP
ncbi:DUF6221 family protein [Streptomyces poriferorum]|uniref:DUF6221 family protein n=1 Tax=Streptomyces poriferorum TaxID=2798799 RepID=A0ABY9J195_9ACTN|nr:MULTISPECIES: DUF6221 family protein [unclassified Streptomyces]MDP5310400.1 DUF6221 family protein [Streptomyces sp. Alt4]WLQ60446.1 DUF6221 family protein [Streptomyces sp. Alt2]